MGTLCLKKQTKCAKNASFGGPMPDNFLGNNLSLPNLNQQSQACCNLSAACSCPGGGSQASGPVTPREDTAGLDSIAGENPTLTLPMSPCQHSIQSNVIANAVKQLAPAQANQAWPHSVIENAHKQAHRVQFTQQQETTPDLGQKIALAIGSSKDSETLLGTIAQLVRIGLQADCCLIALWEKGSLSPATLGGRSWQTLYASPGNTQALISALENQGTGLPAIEAQFEEAEILVIEDVEMADAAVACVGLWEALEVRAVLGVKTEFQGQVNGGIAVMRQVPYCWTDSDRELLKTVSDQVAVAISQVVDRRLIGILQGKVGAFNQHRSLINQLTMAIHNALDLNPILQMAINGITETLQVNQGLILLLKYADPLFSTRVASAATKRIPKAKATVVCQSSVLAEDRQPTDSDSPQSESLLNQWFWVADCALCSLAFTEKAKPLAITDKREIFQPNPAMDIASVFSPENMPALLLVPLVGVSTGLSYPGTVLGFLALQHNSPRVWATEELELVELMAAQLSTAIIQTQTMQHVQALVEERTAQLQRSLEVQAKLYEKTRQQIDQLRRLNQLKDEFLAAVGHELRTPLTSMTLAIRMLRQEGLSNDRREKYLDILEQQCLQETNLVNDLLRLQKLESNQADLQVEKVDLNHLIGSLAESFSRTWALKNLQLSVNLPKRSVKLETDQDGLNRILEELLTNAGKYSDPGTTVVLRVSQYLDDSNSHISISLSNIGRGISPEELPYIFDKFRRGQGVTQQAIAGTGLGLALVKCLTQHLNAKIEVVSSPGAHPPSWETCFTLTLPQMLDLNKL